MIIRGRRFGVGGVGNRIGSNSGRPAIEQNCPSTICYIPLPSELKSDNASISPETSYPTKNHCFEFIKTGLHAHIRSTHQCTGSSIAHDFCQILRSDYDGVKHECGFFRRVRMVYRVFENVTGKRPKKQDERGKGSGWTLQRDSSRIRPSNSLQSPLMEISNLDDNIDSGFMSDAQGVTD